MTSDRNHGAPAAAEAASSRPMRSRSRRRTTKGAELIEFTLNFLPLMIMVVVLVDTSWAIFAHATLQQAVRMAVRKGVTYSSTQVNGNLTATVKKDVQDHSVGLLRGTTGLDYIKVHYFDQDDTSLDVSNTPSGNRGGNIMRVSVENYPVSPLMARFFGWNGGVSNNPTAVTVYAADVIEPISSSLTPAIGPAP